MGSVKLEDHNEGTKLIYTVEANVGGKIAQIGSRLIDMTAKKMADIFFGKFSDLVVEKNNSRETSQQPSVDNNIIKLKNNSLSKKKSAYIILTVIACVIAYFLI